MITDACHEFLEHIENRHLLCVKIMYDDYTRDLEILLKKDYDQEELQTFLNKLKFDYDDGYGHQYIYGTIWYTDGTWSTRGAYDGSERWEHHTLPEIPAQLL